MRSKLAMVLCFLCAALALAQTALTNDSIVKMVKAGLGDDVIISTIKSQPAKYSIDPDGLIALKSAGVSDRVIAAIVDRMAASGPAPAPFVTAAGVASSAGPVNEVGVYYRKGGAWVDLNPEVADFKTGGVLKSVSTIGIVKHDVNGHVNGAHSSNELKSPVDILVYTPEGVAITEYQLLHLREQKKSREFRTITGGVLHESGGATRDLLPFESKKIAPRTYEIVLPSLLSGEYGLLPPAAGENAAGSGRIGKVYSFRIVE
jgi:hypothetical protein